jgi:hypothetical protein
MGGLTWTGSCIDTNRFLKRPECEGVRFDDPAGVMYRSLWWLT